MTEGNRPMKVSDEARKAAEVLFYLACDGADKGHIEEAFARFEADVRKDERERCISVIAPDCGHDQCRPCSERRTHVAAIRSLKDKP